MSTQSPSALPASESRRSEAGGSDLPNMYVNELRDTELALSFEPGTTDPNTFYRYVKDDPRRIARHRALGFRVVLASKGGPKPMIEGTDAADGTIRVGDTVLMSCPKEKVEKRRAAREALATARREREDNRVKKEGERMGVKVINHSNW